MARCLLVYFSQSGSTAKVADRIAAGLRESGYQVDLHNLFRNPASPSPLGYDLLGVGSPVYYYRLPFNVSDYVNGLPNLRSMPVFSFVVWATYRREAGNYLSSALIRRGGRVIASFNSKGAGLFFGYIRQGYRFSVEHPNADDLLQAESFGRDVAAQAAGGRSVAGAAESPASIIERLERLFTSRPLARLFYSRLFSVDSRRCRGCGHCAETCPTGNIVVEGRGHPEWGRNCLLCLTCETECPNDAITSPLSWPVFSPFMMYNVYHASRDPALSHVRVTHSHGRTKTL